MFTLTKLNNEVIKPLPVYHPRPDQILGYNIILLLYSNIFVCGRKGSGKTNVINHMIKKCIDKETKVIVFSATHNSDANWLEIKKWLEERKQPAMFYLNIREGKTSHIQDLVQVMQEEDEAEQAQNKIKKIKKDKKVEIIKFNDGSEEESTDTKLKIKIKKKVKTGPKYMFIFDDISAELKQKNVRVLLKHYKSKVIISSQYPNDIDRAARVQIDFWCLFKGFEPLKMEEVFPQLDIDGLDFEGFYRIYKNVTSTPHNFLYVDKGNNELRENFDQKINL